MTRALMAAVLAAVGCGYHLPGTSEIVPASARTISIRLFSNHTRERGLEVQLRRMLEDEVRRRSVLKIVSDPQGDVILAGTIRRFGSTPVAFNSADVVLQVSVTVSERESGHVLYDNPLIQETEDFAAESNVVVTTSPQFQRGAVDRRDLENLTSVQLGETRKHEALGGLLERLVNDIYTQALEGF